MNTTNKWISSEEILDVITNIGSFNGRIHNLNGTLEWYDRERDFTIYATPNWENDGEVPFDIDRGGGSEIWNVCTIKMIDDTKTTQLTHYLNVLMMIMNHYKDYPKFTENE